MPEIVRSIANRLREFVGNRRRARRFRVRLPLSIMLLDVSTATPLSDTTDAPHLHTLRGHTCDISATGLGLIVPAIRVGERYLTGEGRELHIRLELPSAPLHIRARPVRYERLEPGAKETGYVIGVHITEMSQHDRTIFNQYLKTLGK